VRRLEGEIQTIDTRRWSICPALGIRSPLSSHRFRIVQTGTAEATCHSVRPRRESPIGNLLPKPETNGAFFLDANDNRLCRMSLSSFCGPGKDDLNPTSIPIRKRNSFPRRETWGRMTFQ
jgi:hypothetical protein